MFSIRAMKKSEHTEYSWKQLFEDDEPRDYCIVNDYGRVVADLLTCNEAAEMRDQLEQEYEQEYEWEQMELDAEYGSCL